MKMKKSVEVAPEPQAIAEAAGIRPGSVLKSMNYENLDAEKILTNFGTFGFYQMFVYAMANLGFFLFACETMIFSLISEPEFECRDPELLSQTSETQNMSKF
uniref:Uncharacterized protein n=1 Tax=Panagrolaimus superbus TaxID=310955 RepID=A0A914YSV7_9BILA